MLLTRFRTILKVSAAALPLLFAIGCGSTTEAPPPETNTAATVEAARLERGRYLVESVAMCYYCHSDIDWEATPPLPKPGMNGAGAPFPEKALPGRIIASNITPDEPSVGWTYGSRRTRESS